MRLLLGLLLCLGLAACQNLPRGAALQSEVLRGSDLPPEQADFTVAPVTRALLPAYDSWPVTDKPRLAWINRTQQPANRIIAPGDTLALNIWSTEESGLLTQNGDRNVTLPALRVSSGGTVFLPYVGALRLAGMSPESARERVEEAYLEVIPSAQVLLEMQEGRQNSISLIGGVGNPGSYPLPDRNFTVLELIALGGGVSSSLQNPQIRLNRGGQSYGTSMARLLETPQLNTTLVGGDQIFVEADTRVFYSLGAAGTEAVHRFPRDRLTALEGMAIMGGLSDSRADPEGILILRDYPPAAVQQGGAGGPAKSRVVFTIDLTSADGLFSAGQFQLRSGDLVYATESPVTSAQTIFGLVGNAFGVASRAAALSN